MASLSRMTGITSSQSLVGTGSIICCVCTERTRLANKNQCEKNKQESGAKDGSSESTSTAPRKDVSEDPDDTSKFLGLSKVPLDTFLDELSAQNHFLSVSALVNVAGMEGDTSGRVKMLVQNIWDRLQYRFV